MSTANTAASTTASKSKTAAKSEPAADKAVSAPAVAEVIVQTLAPATIASDNETDMLVSNLVNPDWRKARIEQLDSRIEGRKRELALLEQARALLSGEATVEDETPEAAPARKPKAAAVSNGEAGTRGSQQHGEWIMKAIGNADLSKSEISDKLKALGHPMDSGNLSTYLSLMCKRQQLLQEKQGPRRSTYKRNPKYTA